MEATVKHLLIPMTHLRRLRYSKEQIKILFFSKFSSTTQPLLNGIHAYLFLEKETFFEYSFLSSPAFERDVTCSAICNRSKEANCFANFLVISNKNRRWTCKLALKNSPFTNCFHLAGVKTVRRQWAQLVSKLVSA